MSPGGECVPHPCGSLHASQAAVMSNSSQAIWVQLELTAQGGWWSLALAVMGGMGGWQQIICFEIKIKFSKTSEGRQVIQTCKARKKWKNKEWINEWKIHHGECVSQHQNTPSNWLSGNGIWLEKRDYYWCWLLALLKAQIQFMRCIKCIF